MTCSCCSCYSYYATTIRPLLLLTNPPRPSQVRADDLLQLHALHAAAAAGGGAGGGWLRVTAVDLPSKRVLAVDDRAAALGASVAVRKIGVGSLPGALVARRSDEGALVGYQLPMLDAAWGLAELQRHADASGAEREAGTQLASTQVRAALKREQWLVVRRPRRTVAPPPPPSPSPPPSPTLRHRGRAASTSSPRRGTPSTS